MQKFFRKPNFLSRYFLIFVMVCTFSISTTAKANKCSMLLENDSRFHSTVQNLIYWGIVGSAFLSEPLFAIGGFSGSGGGNGVIHFNDMNTQRQIRTLVKAKKPIPKNLLQNTKIKSLERWEMEQDSIELLDVSPNLNREQILEIVYQRLRMVSPVIAQKMEQLSDWMRFEDWNPIAGLSMPKDFVLNHTLKTNELIAPLALRLSNGNNKREQGPTRRSLELKVIYNSDYFDLLEPIDQAMLIFHEQIYALAQANGHTSSDQIRPLVKLFFSSYFDHVADMSQNGIYASANLIFYKTKINEVFGDYTVYFNDLRSMPKGKVRSATRHLYVFAEVIDMLRVLMANQDHHIPQHQRAENSFLALANNKDLSPEQAFIFLNYFFLEKTLGLFNSESIMDHKIDDIEQKRRLKIACELIETHSPQLIDGLPAVNLALIYCQ